MRENAIQARRNQSTSYRATNFITNEVEQTVRREWGLLSLRRATVSQHIPKEECEDFGKEMPLLFATDLQKYFFHSSHLNIFWSKNLPKDIHLTLSKGFFKSLAVHKRVIIVSPANQRYGGLGKMAPIKSEKI